MSRKLSKSTTPNGRSAYETDLHAWALANAWLLRTGRLTEIDAANIAEELEDMGRSERRALASHIRVLLAHLLERQAQPGLRSLSWRLSIRNARDEIDAILQDSPSLRREIDGLVAREYAKARSYAADETGLPHNSFPITSPYRIEELLDQGFLPANADPA